MKKLNLNGEKSGCIFLHCKSFQTKKMSKLHLNNFNQIYSNLSIINLFNTYYILIYY